MNSPSTIAHPISMASLSGSRNPWTVLAGVVWLGLVIGVYLSLRQFDSSTESHLVIAARLAERSGSVKVRPEVSILWNDARISQGLGYGDVVATGTDGKAAIDFPGGRRIVLGPNSMVRIERAGEADVRAGHLSVVLLRGQVAAVSAKPSKARTGGAGAGFQGLLKSLGVRETSSPGLEAMTIKSGGKVFEVVDNPKATLALAKQPNAEPEIIEESHVLHASGKSPARSDDMVSPGGDASFVPLIRQAPRSVSLAPEVEAVEQPSPSSLAVRSARVKAPKIAAMTPSVPKADPHDFDPVILGIQDAVFMTAVSLKSACSSTNDLSLAISPRKQAVPPYWRPFVEVRPDGGSAFRIFGSSQSGKQFVRLDVEEACRSTGAAKGSAGISMSLLGGQLGGEGHQTTMSQDPPSRLTLASLADLPERPITAHFQRIKAGDFSPAGWIPLSSVKDEPYRLRVKSYRELSLLWPYFRGNGRVALSNRPALGAPAVVHFHDARGWVASLGAPEIDLATVAKFQKLFGAVVAFSGPEDGYVRLPLAVKARLNLIEGALRQDGEISLLVRDRIVRVTLEDLNQDIESLAGLGRSATALFRKGVRPILP